MSARRTSGAPSRRTVSCPDRDRCRHPRHVGGCPTKERRTRCGGLSGPMCQPAAPRCTPWRTNRTVPCSGDRIVRMASTRSGAHFILRGRTRIPPRVAVSAGEVVESDLRASCARSLRCPNRVLPGVSTATGFSPTGGHVISPRYGHRAPQVCHGFPHPLHSIHRVRGFTPFPLVAS